MHLGGHEQVGFTANVTFASHHGRMLQAGPVKTKKTKKGEQKAPRAKSAYLFFQADKRPALKGVRCGLHWALMHALYILQTCMLGNAFGMHKEYSVPHYEALLV